MSSRRVVIDAPGQHFPDVMSTIDASVDEPRWQLLGVHASSVDVPSRNLQLDESLGLNTAWYAGILMMMPRQ